MPKEISADARAELVRALEKSAEVQAGAVRKMEFDAAQTLFVIAATVATLDIVWKWYQAALQKNVKTSLCST